MPRELPRGEPPLEPEEELEPRGEARRWRADAVELWRIDTEARARRLFVLGGCGVGAFVDGGVDDEGPWLLRRIPPETLHDARKRRGAWPWSEAGPVIEGLAVALTACEERNLSPGPLVPRRVGLEGSAPVLLAEALVGAVVGEAGAGRDDDTRAADLWWCPPEADGWNAAANRYALGILAWQLLAGEHPFGGAGLRHAQREAGAFAAPPLPEAVAASLPPGVHGWILRAIDPEPERRPASAEALLEGLRRPDEAAPERPDPPPPPSSKSSPVEAPEAPLRPVPHVAWVAAAVVAGGIGAWLLVDRRAPPPAVPAPPAVTPLAALAPGKLTSERCAECHPRQAAEWEQSVMGHSVESPLFNGLEALIEEQVGRDDDCPNGAGVLRRADGATACRADTGFAITGSGGEHWCVNCHAPNEQLEVTLPAWEGRRGGDPRSRHPVRDLLTPTAREGINCSFCHQVHGPVGPAGSGGYEGNPDWTSFLTGRRFLSRPEDRRGVFGIANSGYRFDRRELLPDAEGVTLAGKVIHARPSEEAKRYLSSSQFCGACHDVRLFGTDVLGAQVGEHFKRLRNAFSEWERWAADERSAGRAPASCQDCHMSTFPGVCEPGDGDDLASSACPDGMRFSPRAPGGLPTGFVAAASGAPRPVAPHWFSGVDVPLAASLDDGELDRPGVDTQGIPLSLKARRDLLLRSALELRLGEGRTEGGRLLLPLEIENVGAGHRVPAGFSQEREIWVHLRVTDADGRLVYEVGRVERNDEDLHDKTFLRVNTDPRRLDRQGRPEGMFGADIADGPDVPRWSPPPDEGTATFFRGRGLINFQNGFLRCVRCRGAIGADGQCLPLPGERHRAERFDDGDYDLDTGSCRSNLVGRHALFETYFPVGSLDASRGLPRAPDAIIDTRSLAPKRPVTYQYELPVGARRAPFRIEARLMFRSFPPFLVRAFADYEAAQARAGKRPSGPLVTRAMLARLDRVVLAEVEGIVGP